MSIRARVPAEMTIDLYTWPTPNGWKVSILLEEIGTPYRVHAVNVDAGEQFNEAFEAISPYHKTPVIVDNDNVTGKPLAIFESGAILVHLAEKTESDLLPTTTPERQNVFQWLMFQVAGVGPMFSQAHHFLRYAKQKVPYAETRYLEQVRRQYDVMEKRLSSVSYLAGEGYSLADIATVPWITRHAWHGIDLVEFPNIMLWYDRVLSRPAVVKGLTVPVLTDLSGQASAQERKRL